MAIVVLVCRENDTANKTCRANRAFKNGLFSAILGAKRPVFLQCTQCNDPRDTAHTWWGGEGFPGAARVLVGVAMVMINFHIELCVESYAFHLGTGLGEAPFPKPVPR
jgi:hypothetical protein